MISDEIFLKLRANAGSYVSGEKLAADTGKSRTAVWKAVKRLIEKGFKIDAVTNKGYKLEEDGDVLSANVISSLCGGNEVRVLGCVSSTNDEAKKLAATGAKEGTVVVANRQTEGRGRLKRKFHSPEGGLYMSVILRPEISAEKTLFVTAAAAVAVREAIEKVCGVSTDIKWVNDLYLSGKKVCGILSEASVNIESGTTDHIVVGIGINTVRPIGGFPSEIADKAGYISLNPVFDMRNRLCAEIVNGILSRYKCGKTEELLKSYREHSATLGKEVEITCGNESYKGVAKYIDDDFRLVVSLSGGGDKTFSYGDII